MEYEQRAWMLWELDSFNEHIKLGDFSGKLMGLPLQNP